MKSNVFFLSFAALSMSLMLATAHAATTLLSLTDAPTQSDTPYALPFLATDSTMTVSISGYQPPSWEYVTDIGVTLSGSTTNLLGSSWFFLPAAKGTYAMTINDGTSVPGLQFGGLSPGDYDTFSQFVATQPGETYVLSFLYSNNLYGGPHASSPNALLVVQIVGDAPLGKVSSGSVSWMAENAGVPEPSTWAMMLIGFAGLGSAGYRRARAKTCARSLS
jgi:hypothetical protein